MLIEDIKYNPNIYILFFCPVSVELWLSDENQQWGPVLEYIPDVLLKFILVFRNLLR